MLGSNWHTMKVEGMIEKGRMTFDELGMLSGNWEA